MAAILKNLYDVITLSVILQFKISYVGAELHAEDAKIETGISPPTTLGIRVAEWLPFRVV